MFTYCGNNPVNCYDPSGNAYQGIYSQINYSEFEHSYGGHRENGHLRSQEDTVIDAQYMAFYNGIPVVNVPFMKTSAFSFGIIFMGSDVNSVNHVRHEYGHILQLCELGVINYFKFVLVPSLTCFWMDECLLLPEGIYYSLPWEKRADEYGKATHSYKEWAQSASDTYWKIIKSIPAFFP